MKKAGDLLSAIFDEKIMKKAQTYHDLFSSWESIAGESIAAHSRIVELERFVLLIEADHPGWIQILQTKQNDLLKKVCRSFPELKINGIAFRLSRESREAGGSLGTKTTGEGTGRIDREVSPEDLSAETSVDTEADIKKEDIPQTWREIRQRAYGKISDEKFKGTLERLERSIVLKEKLPKNG
jgi:hypothetical protein